MNNAIILFLSGMFLLSMWSCDNAAEDPEMIICTFYSGTTALMLVSDYTTNEFEGGTQLFFNNKKAETFTVTNEYKEPGDFGSVKLFYSELGEKIFEGEIIWMGSGKMIFPAKLTPPKDFERVITEDYVSPKNGFENVFNPNKQTYDIQNAWPCLQSLVAVRWYLSNNPEQKVKYFLYTPSVGVGNPEEWKWVFFLKN